MNYTLKSAAILATTLATILLLAGKANAAITIDFEGEDAATNVSPETPYVSDGFTITPLNPSAAVFDSSVATMDGNTTDFLGFEEGNTLTITHSGEFSLLSLDIGIINYASATSIDFLITGFRDELPNLIFNGIGVSTTETFHFNWSGLTSVTIDVSDDSGIDNVTLVAIPEPTSALLLGLGAIGLVLLRRRTK